jgi:hypothetical protein
MEAQPRNSFSSQARAMDQSRFMVLSEEPMILAVSTTFSPAKKTEFHHPHLPRIERRKFPERVVECAQIVSLFFQRDHVVVEFHASSSRQASFTSAVVCKVWSCLCRRMNDAAS